MTFGGTPCSPLQVFHRKLYRQIAQKLSRYNLAAAVSAGLDPDDGSLVWMSNADVEGDLPAGDVVLVKVAAFFQDVDGVQVFGATGSALERTVERVFE